MRTIPEEYVNLATYLREQLSHLSIRQNIIAQRTGVTASYVSQVLNRTTKPSDGFLEKLEEVLELPLGSLFARLGRPKMDFVQSFFTQSIEVIDLGSISDEERLELTQYLSYLRLKKQLTALSEMKGG